MEAENPGARKTGIVIIVALCIVSVALLAVFFFLNRSKTASRSLIVTVDGKEYLRSPLIAGETIVIRQEDGCENVIRMTENGFYMESSTCPNHECIAQGEVTTENWKQRSLREQVICLPNRVIVSLELTGEESVDPLVPDF